MRKNHLLEDQQGSHQRQWQENITLKWILKETDGEDVDWSQVAQEKSLALGSCEYGTEHLHSIKGTECINQICDYQVLWL
jgi:hypothetical protein